MRSQGQKPLEESFEEKQGGIKKDNFLNMNMITPN